MNTDLSQSFARPVFMGSGLAALPRPGMTRSGIPSDALSRQSGVEVAAMLVDSHCHLDFPDFAGARDAIVALARAAGVDTMLTICTRLDEFDGVHAIDRP